MAETKNWVEKAAKEAITEIQLGTKWFISSDVRPELETKLADIILSHAPVVDAEKLANQIDDIYGNVFVDNVSVWNVAPKEKRVEQLTSTITDNIELDIKLCDECRKRLYEKD